MVAAAGLVVYKSNSDLEKEEQEQMSKRDVLEAISENYIPDLASHIKKAWETNRNCRTTLDERLLDCARARKGEYSPSELARITSRGGADPVFLKLTGTKCRAASSWIRDILLPANDRPWAIKPTQEPDLPIESKLAITSAAQQQMAQMAQEGMQLTEEEAKKFTDMIRDKVMAEIKKEANVAAKRVESRIQDLMDEGDWNRALEEFIEDFVTYPTAFLKGPYEKNKKALTWDISGAPRVEQEVTVAWRRVSPFDAYPSPYARNPDDGDFIEHVRLQKAQLHSMIGLPGYNEDAIRKALNDYDSGLIMDWMWQNFEREYVLNDQPQIEDQKGVIDAVHYWGSVEGKALIEWGMSKSEIPDEQAYYEIDAILIGNYVIRAVLNQDPLGRRPYHYACWDAVPGSMWGIALPEQMEDHQKIINSCTRALLNNMAVASGPQAVVISDMLAEGEDITDIFPLKIWQMKTNPLGTSMDPVKFFQPSSNANELLTVINQFDQKTDDVTNVPRYSYGNQNVGGAAQTSSGLSMLMNSAAKGIRRAIAHIDLNVIQPTVHQAFIKVMTEDPDPMLRGDCKIVPKGSAALLIKDALQNQRREFLALITNETDMQIVGIKGRAALLREFSKELGMDIDLVPSDEMLTQMEQNRIPPEVQQMQEELAKQKQALDQETQKLQQQKFEVEQNMLKLQARDNELSAKEAKQKQELEAEQQRLDNDEAKIEQQKIELAAKNATVEALQRKFEAANSEREAELERRLAQMERRVAQANVNEAIAKAKVEISSQKPD